MRSKRGGNPSVRPATILIMALFLAGCGGGDGGSDGGSGSGLELDSGNIASAATFSHIFMTVDTFNYRCTTQGHNMTGSVIVQAAPTGDQSVSIVSGGSQQGANAYSPNPVTVGLGEKVVWTNDDGSTHTVTSQ